MVSLDEAVVARFKHGSKTFELLVDPDLSMSMKSGNEVDLEDLLASDDIFEDASSGDRASEDAIKKSFRTTDLKEICTKIILKGDIQLTTRQRKEMLERKKKRVLNIIHRNAINPQTRTPHPLTRIEKAMEQARVHIDPFKKDEELVKTVLKAIRPLIPIRFEEVSVAVKISSTDAPKAYGDVRKFGELVREEWQNDGCWIGVVKIPAGAQEEFYDLLNRLTKGEAETKLL